MASSLAPPIDFVMSSSSPRRNKRILLVDDDPVTLHLFNTMLTEAGYVVVPCSDGVAAVEMFRAERRFQVLMTNFQMPRMNGVTLANLLTSVARRLPVLIVSGLAVEAIPLEELWRKNWCFLAKPTSAAVLLKTLDQLCGLIPIHMAEEHVTPSRLMTAKA